MADGIAQARADVESRFKCALALADSEEQRSFFGFEQALWTALPRPSPSSCL